MVSFYGFLICGALFYQASCQHGHQHQAVHQQPPQTAGGQQQAIPPQFRFCRCDELEQCYKDQTTQQLDLFARCRQECGVALLPSDTVDQVSQCYQAYEQGRRDFKTNKYHCVENLINKPCITDQQTTPPPQTTFTVDPSKMVQHRQKRNYKMLYPSQFNLYTSCVKTCRKNQGVVQFNLDGSPMKTAATNPQQATLDAAKANVGQKPGKGYALCAQQLNCHLLPIDKLMQKQAKEICKYQNPFVDDFELKLCTCLETALKQNFQCNPTTTTGSCSGDRTACDGTAGQK